ncbi:hypothetical protein M408DRAFT_333046 [Serendipita vermifera MAFF 305830]|uniref:Uncharacterized protein n=1 Tax=Serendipita vermifera MAFF 305830 TaxID=933852 RepID=A0A0C2W6U7_SERVB|nr:hypothetical protein M408DRAFT_333046 [Serendipita vermifera MAFF 305830]
MPSFANNRTTLNVWHTQHPEYSLEGTAGICLINGDTRAKGGWRTDKWEAKESAARTTLMLLRTWADEESEESPENHRIEYTRQVPEDDEED